MKRRKINKKRPELAHFKKTNKERDGHDIDESMREGAREREIDSQRDREREEE